MPTTKAAEIGIPQLLQCLFLHEFALPAESSGPCRRNCGEEPQLKDQFTMAALDSKINRPARQKERSLDQYMASIKRISRKRMSFFEKAMAWLRRKSKRKPKPKE